MSIHFRLLTETDVKTVLTMDDLIETMATALKRFSTGRVVQPVRTVIAVDGDHAFFGSMPAFVRASGPERSANFGAPSPPPGGASAPQRSSNFGAPSPPAARD